MFQSYASRPGLAILLPLAVALVVCTSSRVGGSSLQEQADAEAPAAFRVETRLVQVDVVVRGDEGPVGDLTVEDFRLYSDGQARDISVFEVMRSGVAESGEVPVELPPAGSEIVSNRPAARNLVSATIILMDRLNTEILDQPRANRQLLEFIESLDDDSQGVAIYELRGQLRLIQDYTSDREVLLQAVRSMDTDFSSQLDASYGEGVTGGFEAAPNEVGLDQDLVNARRGVGIEDRGTTQLDQFVASFYLNDRIRITAEVLESLANHMSGLTGRKNLVWLSGRFPFSFEPRSEFGPNEVAGRLRQLEQTARTLTEANVAVYPISAVGLLTPFDGRLAGSPTVRTRCARSRG